MDASRGQVRRSPGRAPGRGHGSPGPPDRRRIVCLDHHRCHAAAAYFGSGFGGREALVLTNDNSGDGLCATASTGRGLALERHEASSSAPGSLGAFYSFATLALGMKFGEHEYKVMGMAPYASAPWAERATQALRGGIRARREPARALSPGRKRGERYALLLRATLGLRFDAVAGGRPAAPGGTLLRWARSCTSATAAGGWRWAAACS